MVNYPTSLDTDGTLWLVADNIDDVEAKHHNALKDAVIALETALGITGAFNFVTDAEMTTHEGNPTDLHHLTDAQLGALHAVVVAGDLNHNDLANLNAGDSYEHITQTQKNALHAVVTTLTHTALTGKNDEANIKHLTDARVSALHAIYALTNDLAAGEITQLQAIGDVTISYAQWGYVGELTASIKTHMDAANPHSSSASSTDLSNHASATSTHGKTTIAGMEDLHAQSHDNTYHSTNYEVYNANIQSHVGSPPTDSHHAQSHTHDSHTGVLSANEGGTGQSSFTIGDILYASTTSVISKLVAVASGKVLTSKGVSTAPAWEDPAGGAHDLDSVDHSDISSITDAKGAMLWQAVSGTWSRLTPAGTVGHVLKCSNVDGTIGFSQLEHGALSGIGTKTHATIDTHINASAPHSGHVDSIGAESIAGIKTFTSIPVLPVSDPTTDNQASRKAYIDKHLMIGLGNIEWVPTSLHNSWPAFTNSYSSFWHTNVDGTDFELYFILPLPCNRGGLSLYYDGIKLGVFAADGSNYVSYMYTYGVLGNVATNIDSDGLDLTSPQTKTYLTVARDISSYDYLLVRIGTVVATADLLQFGSPLVGCYYA